MHLNSQKNPKPNLNKKHKQNKTTNLKISVDFEETIKKLDATWLFNNCLLVKLAGEAQELESSSVFLTMWESAAAAKFLCCWSR